MKENFVLLPLTKGPCAKGRVGPRTWQDWYRSMVLAKRLQPRYGQAPVLILSNLQVAGERHEEDIYVAAAEELGISNLVVVREAYETMGQLDYALDVARRERLMLVVISTWLHFPRVWWLCRERGVKHHIAWGIPRPSLAVADLILTIAFPILDILGLRGWFRRRLESRRVKGNL
ncbi:MAG: hypothetical protein Q7R85_01990 [bacterium]|nr:hypothetical protein [bacterium]